MYQNTTPDPQNQQQQDPRHLTDVLSYYLGENFSLPAGQSSLPVYINQNQEQTEDKPDLPEQDKDVEIDDPQAKQSEQTPPPIINNLFDQLKKEIEETQRPDAIKLIDNRNLDQRINNSKLLPNLINDLQKLRILKLDKLHLEQYGYYTDLKDKTEKILTLNNLFDTINNDKILTTIQISILLK
ncbi:23489_t:CDS:2, partial [Racocetra persica]